MSIHSVSQLHSAPGMLGPVFTIPATGLYKIHGEHDGGTLQLINASNGSVITVVIGGATMQLTGGLQVQFKIVNPPANTKNVAARIIPYNGLGDEG
jgi:hypothetical protein